MNFEEWFTEDREQREIGAGWFWSGEQEPNHAGHGKDFDLYFGVAGRLLQVLIRSIYGTLCRGGLCIRRLLV